MFLGDDQLEYTSEEAAQKIGLSRQRVNQIIKEMPENNRPIKSKGAYIFTEQNIEDIINFNESRDKSQKVKANDLLAAKNAELEGITKELELCKQLLGSKQQELENNRKLLQEANLNVQKSQENLQEAHKLLDQQQQLQLQSNSKVVELEKQLDLNNSSVSHNYKTTKKRHWWNF